MSDLLISIRYANRDIAEQIDPLAVGNDRNIPAAFERLDEIIEDNDRFNSHRRPDPNMRHALAAEYAAELSLQSGDIELAKRYEMILKAQYYDVATYRERVWPPGTLWDRYRWWKEARFVRSLWRNVHGQLIDYELDHV